MKTMTLYGWLLACSFFQCAEHDTAKYSGSPFTDDHFTDAPQVIPGRIQCEYYDLGGEGVAYHDADSVNSGSGGLNPADGSYLNEFRMREAVDISYTKIDEREIDRHPYNLVEPEKDQLYVGWTEPGEWLKYSVAVQKSGSYAVGLMYTSNRGGQIALSIDDHEVGGAINIPSTFVEADAIPWRQWHHWNYIDDMVKIDLEKGGHVLTLSVVAEGNMNFDYLAFALVD